MQPNPAVFEFLMTRRSRPAKMLGLPVPDDAMLVQLLTAAARVPDHGKLEPWRFIVLRQPACTRLAEQVSARGQALGLEDEKTAKAAQAFAGAHLVVAVISSPKPSEKIPQIEQTLSAGAVCLGLVNAALAQGFGANWLSGWAAHERVFQSEALGLTAEEFVAGFIHLGTETSAPPERPRPDMAAITTWVAE